MRGKPKILVEFRLKLLYQFSETIIKCVWLWIARMQMVATWKMYFLTFRSARLFECFYGCVSIYYGVAIVWKRAWLLFIRYIRYSRSFQDHSTASLATFLHSYSRDWLWNLTSFKGQNKGAAIYVESSTTLHNLLFYVRTLWLNNLTVTFSLVRCSRKIQTYCCLCRVKAKNGNKNIRQKTLLSFITRFFY